MLRQDFIMKMVKRIGALARKLLKKEEEEDHRGALADVHNAYDELLGLDPMLVATMDAQMLIGMLQNTEELPFLARLVAYEARALGLMDDPHAAATRRRALALFDAAAEANLMDEDATALAQHMRGDAWLEPPGHLSDPE